jgi:hypothetical protein
MSHLVAPGGSTANPLLILKMEMDKRRFRVDSGEVLIHSVVGRSLG